MLSEEEIKEVKNQLLAQVQNLPSEKREAAIQQINSLSNEAIEEFVNEQRGKYSEETVYRKILDKKIAAVKIDENEEAIAVLEIRPVSEGHTIIIPKKRASIQNDISKGAFELANKISNLIKERFNAKDVKIIADGRFGEFVLNVFGVYDKDLSLDSEREMKNLPTLEEVAKKFLPPPKKEVIKLDEKSREQKQVYKIPRRIP